MVQKVITEVLSYIHLLRSFRKPFSISTPSSPHEITFQINCTFQTRLEYNGILS